MGVQLGDEAAHRRLQTRSRGRLSKQRAATVLNFLRPTRARSVPCTRRRITGDDRAPLMRAARSRGSSPTSPAPGGSHPPRPPPRSASPSFPEWSEASIRVTAYGAGLVDVVRYRLRELCLRRIDWICLDLPLSEPGARAGVRRARGARILLRGRHPPDLVGDDILRLQYLNEVEADVASAQLASDFGKELFRLPSYGR
jgi:hypothetical protein